ncbi:otu-like cysteine protease domain-containing protein [Cyclospora cayetanensis]|uniref:Otu-like cysteine protease domain-containing protein n=1 Tax=Cyclospora cayetanensis TaxID=88456 RepID=A0A1D3CT80_9EIME|nr:otu-like cysteine protease domain-containing protein [Cyclospora cayetanensis]
MMATDSEQHQRSPLSGSVSVVAAHGTAASPRGTLEGRLGAELEGSQLLRFACHCCKGVNIIICSKTPDGSWLMRRAPPEAHSAIAASNTVEDRASSASNALLGSGCRGHEFTEGWVCESENSNSQDQVPVQITIQPAPECTRSNTSSDDGLSPSQRGNESTSQTGQLDATNSTASTCSSWDSGDLRGGDEPPTPLEGNIPVRVTPKGSKTMVYVRPQQRKLPKAAAPQEKEQVRKAQQQQQLESSALSASKPDTLGEEAAHDAVQDSHGRVRRQKHQMEECVSSSQHSTEKRMQGENETYEGGRPGTAASEDLDRQEAKEESQQSEPKAQELCHVSSRDPASSGGDYSSVTRSFNVAEDPVIAAMAPYLSTRECKGDGNCLYRAFSDQLYGSQDHHLFLRWLAVDVMVRCKETFEAFVDEKWADYREMHALLLLYGTPIFVFDEHLQLLQAFEPDAEKRRPPGPDGSILTPFRVIWHGKLGHYTSLHYVKEGFPIARGLTIGALEAEGLARLVLSQLSGETEMEASQGASTGDGNVALPAALEEEALAECLQVSTEELADLAAEQAMILAAIKRQRMQELLPQTTRMVDKIWNEARKEQEMWTVRLAKCPQESSLLPPRRESAQRMMPWRAIDGLTGAAPGLAAAAAAPAVEGFAANVRTSAPPFQSFRRPIQGSSCSPSTVCYVEDGGVFEGNPSRVEGRTGNSRGENCTSQAIRYTRPQVWQEQQLKLPAIATASSATARLSQGPPGPAVVSTPVRGPPPMAASRGSLYQQQFASASGFVEQQRHRMRLSAPGGSVYQQQVASAPEFVEQQRQCMRLSDGRLVAVPPMGNGGPVRHGTLQKRQADLQQESLSGAVTRQEGGSTRLPPEEASWFVRWLGSGSQGR